MIGMFFSQSATDNRVSQASTASRVKVRDGPFDIMRELLEKIRNPKVILYVLSSARGNPKNYLKVMHVAEPGFMKQTLSICKRRSIAWPQIPMNTESTGRSIESWQIEVDCRIA